MYLISFTCSCICYHLCRFFLAIHSLFCKEGVLSFECNYLSVLSYSSCPSDIASVMISCEDKFALIVSMRLGRRFFLYVLMFLVERIVIHNVKNATWLPFLQSFLHRTTVS